MRGKRNGKHDASKSRLPPKRWGAAGPVAAPFATKKNVSIYTSCGISFPSNKM